MSLLSHADVVEAFGGHGRLARAIGLPPKLTTHWGRRGIPAKYWLCVEDSDEGKRLGVTARLLKHLPILPEQVAA